MMVMMSGSALAVTFVNIEKLEGHKFPEAIRELDVPVTLLHKHEHDHGYLVYAKDYKTSTYHNDVSNYHACSWYLSDDGEVVPYEYCEEKIAYDLKEIRQRLWDIQETKYDIYGTTVRPLTQEVVELETQDGHVYVKEPVNSDIPTAETAISSPIVHGCRRIIYRCQYGGCQGHKTVYKHQKT